MNISIILNLTGLSFNLIGTIIISFSLRKYFKSVDNSFLALEQSIESISSMLNNQQLNAFIIDGMDLHRKKGQKQAEETHTHQLYARTQKCRSRPSLCPHPSASLH